jgi:hypothetical protein
VVWEHLCVWEHHKLFLNRRGAENAEKKQSYFTSHLESPNRNPTHFSRMNSPHFSDVIWVGKTARYEHLRTFSQKSYVFITGFIQQFS